MSTGGGDGSNGYNYGRARVVAGLALIGLVILLTILDAIRTDYQLDPIELGLILGTGLVLLGVEAGRKLLLP